MNTKDPRLALALCALLVSVVPAFAEGPEIGLYGGLQGAAHSTLSDPAGDHGVGWDGKSFSAPPYWGIRAVWWRDERRGWGIELNHAKIYADDPAKYGYDRLEFTDGLNFVTLNLYRRYPGAGRALVPYWGLGAGVAVPHVDVQPAGGRHTFGYQLTGPVLQGVAGMRYDLNDRWGLFAEAKLAWSSHRARLDGGGHLKTDLFTSAVNLGVNWRF